MRRGAFLHRWLHGRPVRLPGPVDALAERWASLPPRTRLVCAGLVIALAVAAGEVRVQSAERRWGGTPVEVLVATTDLPAGAAPAVRPATVPPALAVAGALAEVPDDTRLSMALPEGAVLTRGHVDPRGPAAGLPPDHRAVPLPVEAGWAVREGGWVDVWTLDPDGTASPVARSRAVLALDVDESDRATALVALHVDEVAGTTAGLAAGQVLLTHAPAPEDPTPR